MRGGGRQYKPWDTMSGVNRQGGLSVENTEEEDSPQIYYNYPPGKILLLKSNFPSNFGE